MPQVRAYWSRRTNLLLLSFFGILTEANVGVRFWRAGAEGWKGPDRLALGSMALMIVGIWFLALRHAKDLDKLAENADEWLVARLSATTYTIAFIAFLMLVEAFH
jgi:hypothetical protein